MASDFSMEQAKSILDNGIGQAQELIQDPSKINDLLSQIEEKLKEIPVIGETVSDLPVMISMIKSYATREYTVVSPKVIALVVSAFLYLVKRKDLIQESIPVLGYADDIAVITLALKLSGPELDAYAQWRENGSVRTAVTENGETQTTQKEAPDMSKVNDFLTEAGTFFLATVDGDQPKLRPLGAHFLFDGKVMFGVGDFKGVYKQLVANPKTEIVACKADGHWMRYTGKAVFETDPKYAEAALEAMPNLKGIYNEQTGHKMMMFHLEDATAVDIAVMGEGVSLI